MAKHYKIHPAIGIARLGNSDEIFVGPLIPGQSAQPSNGKFKTATGQIKRQAAEFRIFEYDDDPTVQPVEIKQGSSNIQSIEWTVKLANRKAAMPEILNTPPIPSVPRNPGITVSELIIAPSVKTVTPPSLTAKFDDGKFRGKTVFLGDISLESTTWRLRVAGGKGESSFVLKPGEQGGYTPGGRLDFANNKFWYDDTSDGSVTATIKFDDGRHDVNPDPAWVIVGPPDFAPAIGNVVTLYDIIYDTVLRNHQLDLNIFDKNASPQFRDNFKPSFTKDIFPILNRVLNYKWVTKLFAHGSFDLATISIAPTASGSDPNKSSRENIFKRLRNPNNPNVAGQTMPKMHGDEDGVGVFPQNGLSLTKIQYEMMRKWKDGRFIGDWTGSPLAPSTIVTPLGMDVAALENCVGGAFYPGIETNRIVAIDISIYQVNASGIATEIRLQPESDVDGRVPGYLTANSALPWQADFLKCSKDPLPWWPAQRPDDVKRGTSPTDQIWALGINNHKDMVEKWSRLGFVVKNGNDYIEDERANPF